MQCPFIVSARPSTGRVARCVLNCLVIYGGRQWRRELMGSWVRVFLLIDATLLPMHGHQHPRNMPWQTVRSSGSFVSGVVGPFGITSSTQPPAKKLRESFVGDGR